MNIRDIIQNIKIKMLNGMSYNEAKKEALPFIDKANKKGSTIAKKYGMKHKLLTFEGLMR